MEKENEVKQEVTVKVTDKLVGTNERQLEVITRMLNEGRRYFGSSGASLTHQISNPIYEDKGIDPTLAKIGLDGEHKTTKMLREWIKDKPNAVLVDSVHVKGYGEEELDEETGLIEGGDTDHVMIIGDMIIIIDSKNWKGRRRYSIDNNGNVKRGTGTFAGGKLNTVRARHLWYSYLRELGTSVSAIIIITSDKVAITKDKNWWKQGYRLISIEEAEEFLDKVWHSLPDDSKETINANLVASVVVNAIKPYDTFKELLGTTADLLDVGK